MPRSWLDELEHEFVLRLRRVRRVLISGIVRVAQEIAFVDQLESRRFDFLGYSFGARLFEASGNWYQGASPSKKSVQRLKTKVGDLLVPSNIDPWPEVRDKLNRSLRGWSNYFGYGSRSKAYRSVDHYVFERVRRFLVRRHKVQGRGNRRFPFDVIHRELGVLCLQRLPRAVPSDALR